MSQMPGPTMSKTAADRMGVYKTLMDVPERHRLSTFEGMYADRDLWEEFIDFCKENKGYSATWYHLAGRTRRRFEPILEERGRSAGFMKPEDVLATCEAVAENAEMTETVYHPYFVRLEAFYDWLVWHTEFPHRYNVALMAVVEYPDSIMGDVWSFKTGEACEFNRS